MSSPILYLDKICFFLSIKTRKLSLKIIFLLKAPNIEYDIPSILIEFKFLKQKEKFNLDKIVAGAREQIIKYKSTSKFSVDRSIIVVFQGFKLVYCKFEEV